MKCPLRISILFGVAACSVALLTATTSHAQGKLKLLGGPVGAEVVINGASVGTLPLRHAVAVTTEVDLVLRQDGQVVHRERLSVTRGQRLRHQLPDELGVKVIAPPTTATSVVAAGAAQTALATHTQVTAKTPTTSSMPSSALTPSSIGGGIGQRIGVPLETNEERPANALQPKAVSEKVPNISPAHVARTAQAAQPLPASTGPRAPEVSPPAAYQDPATNMVTQPESSLSARETSGAVAASEEAAGDDDILDLFILESFAGPSFMAMALGRNDELISNLASLPAGGAQGVDFNNIQLTDVVNTVSETGTTVGGAASLRLAFISLGGRLSYSSYSSLEMMTPTFELAFRAFGDPIELYIGFGLGAAFMYNVSRPVTQRDGMSLRAGLALSYRFTPHASLGLGADAVGWFLAGKGISPAQLGEIDQNINHPVGGQVPVQANFSILL